jgi:hypothetical protein
MEIQTPIPSPNHPLSTINYLTDKFSNFYISRSKFEQVIFTLLLFLHNTIRIKKVQEIWWL